jgi:hypothetical protein
MVPYYEWTLKTSQPIGFRGNPDGCRLLRLPRDGTWKLLTLLLGQLSTFAPIAPLVGAVFLFASIQFEYLRRILRLLIVGTERD